MKSVQDVQRALRVEYKHRKRDLDSKDIVGPRDYVRGYFACLKFALDFVGEYVRQNRLEAEGCRLTPRKAQDVRRMCYVVMHRIQNRNYEAAIQTIERTLNELWPRT